MDLQQRIELLEKQTRRLKVAVLLAFALMGALVLSDLVEPVQAQVQRPQVVNEVTAKKFKLIDNDGNELASWFYDGKDTFFGMGKGAETVTWGRLDGFRGAPDFEFNHANHKVLMRSLIIADIGDAIDLAFRRAGPDNADYDASPKAVKAGDNIGTIYWQPFGTNNDFDAAKHLPPGDRTGRIAQIYARATQVPTGTNRPGSLHFATTVPNRTSPDDRMIVDHHGCWLSNITASPDATPNGGTLYVENGALRYRGPDGAITQLAPR